MKIVWVQCAPPCYEMWSKRGRKCLHKNFVRPFDWKLSRKASFKIQCTHSTSNSLWKLSLKIQWPHSTTCNCLEKLLSKVTAPIRLASPSGSFLFKFPPFDWQLSREASFKIQCTHSTSNSLWKLSLKIQWPHSTTCNCLEKLLSKVTAPIRLASPSGSFLFKFPPFDWQLSREASFKIQCTHSTRNSLASFKIQCAHSTSNSLGKLLSKFNAPIRLASVSQLFLWKIRLTFLPGSSPFDRFEARRSVGSSLFLFWQSKRSRHEWAAIFPFSSTPSVVFITVLLYCLWCSRVRTQ